MISLILALVLWLLVAVMAFLAWRKGGGVLAKGLREGGLEFLYLVPRLAIGVIGSGFLAALVPEEWVRQWLGAESGILGLFIASLAGALTPGGPVVGFAIGAAAWKSGASLAPVVAYVTAWALFAIQRLFVWELPIMPARIVWIRVAASLPIPVIAALIVAVAVR